MAALSTLAPTLLDVKARLDPNGSIAALIELLSETNEMLDDMSFIEGNLATGARVTVRTGLPKVYWRLLNRGVPASKSRTAQVDESCGMLEAWAEIDKDLAELNGNSSAFKLSEASAFIEAMNQEMASTVIYGNSSTDPEQFNGLAVRYSDLSAPNAQNIIDAGGTGSDNTSIYLVVWGSNTCTGIYPKGSTAGLTQEDLGVQTVIQSDTDIGSTHLGGAKLRAHQLHYQWKAGLCVKDWRYVVRIANIDVSTITGDYDGSDGFTHDLQRLMIRALHRVPNLRMGRPVFYCNRTIRQVLDIQALEKASNQLTIDNFDGRLITRFRGVPIKTVDALLETEARVV